MRPATREAALALDTDWSTNGLRSLRFETVSSSARGIVRRPIIYIYLSLSLSLYIYIYIYNMYVCIYIYM